ncbi:MAG: response regulator [Candidatus Omnitrophica bacterium]|nr:response regulator [Candidatus Omnitrophota bacterium]
MKRPVVLAVDDEDDVRQTVVGFLEERFECDFNEAQDGDDAVLFLRTHPCDIIILDIKMPKKGGMAVITEAKKIDPAIDILVVSAWVSDEVADEAMQLGATDYAVKPLDLKVVTMKFGRILEKRGQKISKI